MLVLTISNLQLLHTDCVQSNYAAQYTFFVNTDTSPDTLCKPWSFTKDFNKFTNYFFFEKIKIGYTLHTHFIADENPVASVSLSKLHRLNI